jgi:hypothetical protein
VPEAHRVRRGPDTLDDVVDAAVAELVVGLERPVAVPHPAAAVVEVNEVSQSVPGVVNRVLFPGAGRTTRGSLRTVAGLRTARAGKGTHCIGGGHVFTRVGWRARPEQSTLRL